MKRISALLLIVVGTTFLFSQCKKKEEDEEEEQVHFDKAPVMTNLADNYIIPGYNDLQTKMNTLQSNWGVFLTVQTQANLNLLKTSLTEANISFHRVKIFDVGPAMSNGLMSALGTFPADTSQIKNNISAGSYVLTTADNIDAIGFDALDYLFYRTNALTLIQTSTACQQYITDVITKMKNEVDYVVNGWTSYRATFVAGVGTSSTDPFSILVNAFCRDFELAKTLKLGFPIGNQTMGIQQAHYLEARRSGIGQLLLKTNIKTVHDVFQGMSYDGSTNGQGYDDYLNAIGKTSLTATINTRFDYMKSHPDTWSGGIEGMMTSNAQTLTDFYNYMQGSVVYLKTDMSSSFGVLITYQDNDGD